MAIIYKIENLQNGKLYIGVTTGDLKSRWREHKAAFREGKDMLIYKAMNKYGIDSFEESPRTLVTSVMS